MNSNQPRPEPAADDPMAAMAAALFRCHASAVFAVCLANTRNYHDAEDVMQAVFLKATAEISSLREPSKARAWLLQVARRGCIDFHRRRKRTEPLLEEPPAPPAGADTARQRLHEAIRRLPQSYREVIVHYYLEGRNCSSVAASLGMAEPAVRQRLVRARAMLHKFLEEERP
jgi:RNA polymerase sigma factor (sigma-70 family)